MPTITIERETLERAVTALVYHQQQTRPIERTQIAIRALRAALAAQLAEPVACKGIPRKGCNYLAPTDTVCNKCGKIHHHHQMLAHFYAASPAPAAVPLTDAQLDRLYANSPEFHKDAKSATAFKRIVRLAERVHRITAGDKP